MVNDRGAFYSRRRGRDSNTGGNRDRYHSSYSGTVFNGNFHRLQTPVRKNIEYRFFFNIVLAISWCYLRRHYVKQINKISNEQLRNKVIYAYY